MKVYERWKNVECGHPEDMEKILTYLSSNGKLNISPASVERLYGDFSNELYDFYDDRWEWAPVTEEVLDRFADWLNDYEI